MNWNFNLDSWRSNLNNISWYHNSLGHLRFWVELSWDRTKLNTTTIKYCFKILIDLIAPHLISNPKIVFETSWPRLSIDEGGSLELSLNQNWKKTYRNNERLAPNTFLSFVVNFIVKDVRVALGCVVFPFFASLTSFHNRWKKGRSFWFFPDPILSTCWDRLFGQFGRGPQPSCLEMESWQHRRQIVGANRWLQVKTVIFKSLGGVYRFAVLSLYRCVRYLFSVPARKIRERLQIAIWMEEWSDFRL